MVFSKTLLCQLIELLAQSPLNLIIFIILFNVQNFLLERSSHPNPYISTLVHQFIRV